MQAALFVAFFVTKLHPPSVTMSKKPSKASKDLSMDELMDMIERADSHRLSGQCSPGPELGWQSPSTREKRHTLTVIGNPEPRSRAESPVSRLSAASANQRSDSPASFFGEGIDELADQHPMLQQYSWYAEALTRGEAETRLSMSDEGTFLVRKSGNRYALSIKWTQSKSPHWCTHVKITYHPTMLFQLCAADSFESIPEIVEFYGSHLPLFAHRFWPDATLLPPPFTPYQYKKTASTPASPSAQLRSSSSFPKPVAAHNPSPRGSLQSKIQQVINTEHEWHDNSIEGDMANTASASDIFIHISCRVCLRSSNEP